MRVRSVKILDLRPNDQRQKQSLPYSINQRGPNSMLVSICVDLVGTVFALLVAKFIIINVLNINVPLDASFPVLMLTMVVSVATFFSLSVYDVSKYYTLGGEIKRITGAVALSLLVLVGVFWLFSIEQAKILVPTMFFTQASILIGWRLVTWFGATTQQLKNPQRVLLVGANDLSKQVANLIQRSLHLELFGFVDDSKQGSYGDYPIVGKFQDVRQQVEQNNIDEVIITLSDQHHEQISQLLSDLQTLSVQIRIVPSYLNFSLYRAYVDDLAGLPLINLRGSALNAYQRLIKRAFDFVVAGLILITIAPVMAVIAIAIKLDSPGPILFRQVRVGEGGKVFKMYKFRSMVEGAEELQHTVNTTNENGEVLHKHRDDPRVTKVGQFIRRTSLDELPQFINVLLGEMSLVGPRPELPWLVEKYEPWQHQRFSVPQGVTGWWQVNGRSDKPCHLNTDQDLYYIQNYSFWMDIKILLKTVPALIRGKGAF